MRRSYYFPIRQADQTGWLGNFSHKLPEYTAALGLTPEQVAAAVADCGWLMYLSRDWLPGMRAWALSGTEVIAEARAGAGANVMALPEFTAPPLPEGVGPVKPGALDRIFALIQLIKDGGKCTDTIAANLSIVGTEETGPDLATIQPVIAVSRVGNQVQVKWGWGGYSKALESCEIEVDRGDGKGFGLLTIDTTPNYVDSAPFPAAGQSALWKYRASYRQNDGRVGVWSQVASLAVAG